jgi:Na+-transporting NADH:ubiquinone oxidoreductase subunit F
MLEVGLGIVTFTGIVLALAAMILLLHARLVPSGEVWITVNDSQRLKARAGGKLLRALDEAGLRLPSACGGVGTCGQCRLEVLEGADDPLPTEAARITRRELAQGTRLACQVTVRQDLHVQISKAVLGAKQWRCRVRSNANVATLIKEVVLELPPGETFDFRAGSYILLDCPPYEASFRDFDIAAEFRDEWDRLDLWRFRAKTTTTTTRAYSLANAPEENNIVRLVVRIAIPPPAAATAVPPGAVSSFLFNLRSGDEVSVSGPFGHFFARESDREMVFVGGGAGMAPMRAHILDQLERLNSARTISFWYGARSLRELFYREAFDRLAAEHANFRWVVALSEPRREDRWDGAIGFIHQVLYKRYLKDHPAPEDCDYYLCGPPMMVKAIRALLDDLGVDPENVFFDDFGG